MGGRLWGFMVEFWGSPGGGDFGGFMRCGGSLERGSGRGGVGLAGGTEDCGGHGRGLCEGLWGEVRGKLGGGGAWGSLRGILRVLRGVLGGLWGGLRGFSGDSEEVSRGGGGDLGWSSGGLLGRVSGGLEGERGVWGGQF